MTGALPDQAQRWRHLRALLDEALDLDAQPRARFVETVADSGLRADLERLLAEHARNQNERSLDPVELAATLLVDPHERHDAEDDARVGQNVGPFRLLRLIGTGGMGAVYLAERKVENFVHRVALKVVRSDDASATARERFERERQILANLVHPHIGTLFEGGQTREGQPYYTMEFVDGVAITEYCRDHQLGVAQRVNLLTDVASALSHAHQNLVVHRDIKPSNILVTADGRAKLLDFGIAKRVGQVDAAATQAALGPMTPEYAAPEQFQNAPVTVATDVYQFGVLCFRVLTGSLPYRADSSDGLAWARAVTTAEPTLLPRALDATPTSAAWKGASNVTRLKRQLGGDLDAIVRRMLAKAPGDRYASMDAVIADFDAYQAGRPVTARRAGALYFAHRFVTRRPWAVAAGAAVVVALMAATAISVSAARHSALQAHRAEVTNRFLLTALDLTDRFSGNNRGDFTLSDVLERAVAQARTELRDEPALRANVLTQLSMGLQHRGKLAQALEAAQEAYDLRIASGAVGMDMASASQQMASAEIESGTLDAAARHLDETLRQLRAVERPERALIQAYTSLGKLASMRGDAAGSLGWYEKVVPLREALSEDHDADLAMDYNNLGTGYFNLSRFSEAEQAYLHGIDLLRQKLGGDHPRIGFVQFGLASAQMQLGRFDDARATLDAAETSLNAGNGQGSSPSSVNIERARGLLDYFAGDYASARRRFDVALTQARSASPVSVAGMLVMRGRIQLADDDAIHAVQTFAEAERLFVDNGRGAHVQRWYARGLGGVSRAKAGEAEAGDAELDDALRQLGGVNARVSFEQAELCLYAGAAARRRGDIAAALVLHRRAAVLQRQIGWLGELGAARVDAELAQDGYSDGADGEAREHAAARTASSLSSLRRIAPGDPRVGMLQRLQPDD